MAGGPAKFGFLGAGMVRRQFQDGAMVELAAPVAHLLFQNIAGQVLPLPPRKISILDWEWSKRIWTPFAESLVYCREFPDQHAQ